MNVLISNGRIVAVNVYDDNGQITDGGCVYAWATVSDIATAPDEAKVGDGLRSGVLIDLPSSLEEYDAALTQHLYATAQERRYSDRISCSVRAGYVGPFQAEGIAFATWMDTCNAIGYTMLSEYQQGLIPQPTIAEMLAALPEMAWPN